MRYVQRDIRGKIVGVYSNPQPQEDGFCLTDPEPLSDDHPEVAAFLAAHPIPESPVPTKKELEDLRIERERLERETTRLQKLMLGHFQEMAELELALSGLLQQILNLQGAAQNVARAIYFSIPGFEQRCTTVTRALQQFVADHLCTDRKKYADLESLIGLWSRIGRRLKDVRGVRNVVAHGSICSVPHGGKMNVRLMAPAFDPLRVGNLLRKGTNPGIGPDDLNKAIAVVRKVSACVDRMNETITAFHQFGIEGVQKTRPRLEANLQALESLA